MTSLRGNTLSRILAVVWLAFTSGRARAQAPYIVKDLNTSTVPGTVGLVGPWGSFFAAGQRALMRGFEPSSGVELWSTDGTVGGTGLLADLCPGACAGNPTILGAVHGVALGFTDPQPDPFHPAFPPPPRLWRSDGTPQGTYLLPGVAPGRESVVAGGHLYYGLDYTGVWRTDGTNAGTQHLDWLAPLVDTGVGGLTAFGDRIVFVDNGSYGARGALVSSDGTPAGTTILHGFGLSDPAGLAAAGNLLFFVVVPPPPTKTEELWVSDGTVAGTHAVQTFAGVGTFEDHGSELWALPLAGAGCEALSAVLCVQGDRFAVTAEWEDSAGNTGMGQAVALTGDTGYFWFFDPANVEVIVKVLDGRPLNGNFWVFYGALSDVRYALTVTDTVTGLSRRYENYAGVLASVADTHAFDPTGVAFAGSPAAAEAAAGRAAAGAGHGSQGHSTSAMKVPPAATPEARGAAAGSCSADSGRLCLDAGRFAVEASWTDFSGRSGKGQAVTLTGDTGYFWFFDPASVEVVLKVLDGRAVNGKFWVFYGALSNVEYTLKVTDTATGAFKVYVNPSGTLASVADTSAF